MRSALGRPVCLAVGSHPVLAFLHEADALAPASTAALICPPFGWDELCSYRARRIWAAELAVAGVSALRFDLPGAGDSSGSPRDPELVEAWTAAVAGASAWLAERSGASRIVAIGLGLGGMIAWRAVAGGAPIDDLILWGVPDRGRRLVRELRAYAGTVAGRYAGELPPADLPEGAIDVTGFLLSGTTIRDLDALTLSKLPLPEPERRRILLVERDALGVDPHLRAHVEQSGAALTVAPATDFGELMAHPQHARVPRATIAAATAWLLEAADRPPAPAPAPAPARPPAVADRCAPSVSSADAMVLDVSGVAVRETPLILPALGGESVAILSEPAGEAGDLCVVLLNAGAIRRIGPNRTWVEAARRWAAEGLRCVRVDVGGIGDSDAVPGAGFSDAEMYSPEMVRQVRLTLDALEARGIGTRFALVGLCSGAYWAAHTALVDDRVTGALLINLYAFHWSPELVAARDRRETASALRGGVIKRLLRGGIRRHHLRRAWRGMRAALLARVLRRQDATAVSADALERLLARTVETLLLFSEGEPLLEELVSDGWPERLENRPTIELRRLPSTDHNVRALALQQVVHGELDRALHRVRARRADASARPAGSSSGRPLP